MLPEIFQKKLHTEVFILMKNKKTTYILFFLVILIWGIIGFRIYNHVHDSGTDQTPFVILPLSRAGSDTSGTKRLKLNYNDPFLKRNVSVAKTITMPEKKYSAQTNIRRRIGEFNRKAPEKSVSWPDVSYSGLILNDKTNEELGLLQVNNESYLIRNGDIRNDIIIVKIFSDSIFVSYQDETRTILKTK